MGFLDKVFRQDQPPVPAEEPIQEAESQQKIAKIRSNHDFMLAITDDNRLAEAEAWLMAEKADPSQTGHDELWLQGRLAILYHRYNEVGDTASAKRIYDLLPENIQVDIDQRTKNQT